MVRHGDFDAATGRSRDASVTRCVGRSVSRSVPRQRPGKNVTRCRFGLTQTESKSSYILMVCGARHSAGRAPRCVGRSVSRSIRGSGGPSAAARQKGNSISIRSDSDRIEIEFPFCWSSVRDAVPAVRRVVHIAAIGSGETAFRSVKKAVRSGKKGNPRGNPRAIHGNPGQSARKKAIRVSRRLPLPQEKP